MFDSYYIQKHIMKRLADFVKKRSKETGMTQEEFADRRGVALTVIRKIEQGKTNLNLDKVNLVLQMFGHELAPMNSKIINDEKSRDLLYRYSGWNTC
jgi:y4mF family transcriptional regulator